MTEYNGEKLAFKEALEQAVEIVCNESENNFTGYKKLMVTAISDVTNAQKNGRNKGIPIQNAIDDIVELLTVTVVKRKGDLD